MARARIKLAQPAHLKTSFLNTESRFSCLVVSVTAAFSSTASLVSCHWQNASSVFPFAGTLPIPPPRQPAQSDQRADWLLQGKTIAAAPSCAGCAQQLPLVWSSLHLQMRSSPAQLWSTSKHPRATAACVPCVRPRQLRSWTQGLPAQKRGKVGLALRKTGNRRSADWTALVRARGKQLHHELSAGKHLDRCEHLRSHRDSANLLCQHVPAGCLRRPEAVMRLELVPLLLRLAQA